MNIIHYVENVAIPDLNEEKAEGFVHASICVGTQFDATKVAKEIEKRTNFKCMVCGGTIYVKMI